MKNKKYNKYCIILGNNNTSTISGLSPDSIFSTKGNNLFSVHGNNQMSNTTVFSYVDTNKSNASSSDVPCNKNLLGILSTPQKNSDSVAHQKVDRHLTDNIENLSGTLSAPEKITDSIKNQMVTGPLTENLEPLVEKVEKIINPLTENIIHKVDDVDNVNDVNNVDNIFTGNTIQNIDVVEPHKKNLTESLNSADIKVMDKVKERIEVINNDKIKVLLNNSYNIVSNNSEIENQIENLLSEISKYDIISETIKYNKTVDEIKNMSESNTTNIDAKNIIDVAEKLKSVTDNLQNTEIFKTVQTTINDIQTMTKIKDSLESIKNSLDIMNKFKYNVQIINNIEVPTSLVLASQIINNISENFDKNQEVCKNAIDSTSQYLATSVSVNELNNIQF